jgi:GTP-binding protein
MFNLDATAASVDFTTVYGSAKNGWMSEDWKKPVSVIHFVDGDRNTPLPPQVEGNFAGCNTSLTIPHTWVVLRSDAGNEYFLKVNQPILWWIAKEY